MDLRTDSAKRHVFRRDWATCSKLVIHFMFQEVGAKLKVSDKSLLNLMLSIKLKLSLGVLLGSHWIIACGNYFQSIGNWKPNE